MHATPTAPSDTTKNRLGFHYYPDTLHYRESDLQTWLPELQALGASWLVLQAPAERAIPEGFVRGLLNGGVEPVLHFALPPEQPALAESLGLLFQSYAQWGARYAILFDRPNARSAWSPAAWAQADLVERFLDIYLPLAELALQAGLTPVFPPLEPGSDYWDTAFLRAALRGIRRRGHARLLDSLALSAYACTAGRPLSWGAGGPERWPAARPYFTPTGTQDQVGFRIFDWYLALARAELGRALPVLLLKAGSSPDSLANTASPEAAAASAQDSLAVTRLLLARPENLPRPKKVHDEDEPPQAGNPVVADSAASAGGAASTDGAASADTAACEPVPAEVLAGCFWMLAAAEGSPQAGQAWFQPDGSRGPSAEALRLWIAARGGARGGGSGPTNEAAPAMVVWPETGPATKTHPIAHYLLLPAPEWGGEDWRLSAIRSFIEKHHPTLGYSLDEAALAARVTVVGGVLAYSDQDLSGLYARGCQVERLVEDGMLIATSEA